MGWGEWWGQWGAGEEEGLWEEVGAYIVLAQASGEQQ